MDEMQVVELYESAARGAHEARSAGEHAALLQSARHLRWEHGMSRRKVALRLGVREKWVKEYVDDWSERG